MVWSVFGHVSENFPVLAFFAKRTHRMTALEVPPESNQITAWTGLLAESMPLARFMRRWWLLAVVMTTLSSVVTLGYVLVKGVTYEVSAALLYQLGPELSPPPTMTKDQLMITRRTEDVNDEIEILTSPDLIHDIVADLGEDFFRPPPPTTTLGKLKLSFNNAVQAVTGQINDVMIQLGMRRRLTFLEKIEIALAESLEAELVSESDVISVTLATPAPDAGELILQKLLDAYQERHLAVHQEPAVKNFLADQTGQLRAQLEKSRGTLLEFQTENDLWSSMDQQKLLLENRRTLQMQVSTTSGQVAHLTSLVANLARSVADLPEVIELSISEQANPARVSLEDRMASLNMNSAIIEATYRSGTIEKTAQDRQMRSLESAFGSEPALVPHSRTEGVNEIRQQLVREHALKAAELDGLQDQLIVETTQLQHTDESLKKLGASIAKYQHLEREHSLLEQKYALYVENFEKADIASVMNLARISNVELISPPSASKHPTKPRLKLVAAAGIASGLVLAFVIAVLFELRTTARLINSTQRTT